MFCEWAGSFVRDYLSALLHVTVSLHRIPCGRFVSMLAFGFGQSGCNWSPEKGSGPRDISWKVTLSHC